MPALGFIIKKRDIKVVFMIQKIKDFFEKHKRLGEITRFVIVGGCSTVIDFLAMSLFIFLFNLEAYDHSLIAVFLSSGKATSWSVVVGTGVGFVVSLIFSYLLSTFFVFENSGYAKTVRGASIYAILSIIALGMQTLFMYIGYDILGFNEWILKILITLVTMTFNYLTRKKFIYVEKKERIEESVEPEKIEGEEI